MKNRIHPGIWLHLSSLLVVALLFFVLLFPKIRSGTLWQNDELLTANRAREILVRNDPYTITLNYHVDCHKPPLQYWLTAYLLRTYAKFPELAVRLVPLLNGTFCILAVGFLAYSVIRLWPPEQRVAKWKWMSLSGIAVVVCGYFLHMARVGLLDCGSALYLTLALAGCQLARTNPMWWWFVALQTTLSSWQKAPYALLAWAIILVLRFRLTIPKTARNALITALSLACLWPLLQVLQHGFSPLHAALENQTSTLLREHDLAHSGFRPYMYWFWLIRDWALLGLLCPAVLTVLVWNGLRKRDVRNSKIPQLSALFELSFVAAVLSLAIMLLPFRVERYLVALTPLYAFLTIYGLDQLVQFFTPQKQTLAFILVIGSAVPVAAFHYFSPTPSQQNLLKVTKALQKETQTLDHAHRTYQIVLNAYENPAFNVLGFILFYANVQHPTFVSSCFPISTQEITSYYQTNPKMTYLGVCLKSNFPLLMETFNHSVEIVESSEKWVCWKTAQPSS